jgi:hypothetical protein
MVEVGELRAHGGWRRGDPQLVLDFGESAHWRLLCGRCPVYAGNDAVDAPRSYRR